MVKKVKLLLLQFRLNTVLNTFFVLQCVFVFLLMNSTVSSLVYDGYVGKYADFDEEITLFLSGGVSQNVQPGNPEQFYRLAEEIQAVDGVDGVGYQMNEYFLLGENEDVIVDAFILNDSMLRVKYPLRQGKWFEKDAAKTQVILGGAIAGRYKTGESITLHKLEVIDGSTQYIPINAEVIGKLQEPAFAVNLHYASNQPEYINLFEPYQNIILSNDQSLISDDNVRYPLMSLFVFADRDADLQMLKEKLTDFGQPVDFHEMDQNYKESMAFRLANKLPTTGIMLLGILFGVMGITWLSVYQNMRTLSVYHLYGMSRKGCAFVNRILNVCMLLFSMLCAFLLYFVPAVHNYLFRRLMLGPYNFLFSFAFAAVAAGISFLISFGFSKESPVLILRRFE